MGEILFLVMRRLRVPMIVLITVYAISVGGLAIIPGLDAQGNHGRMSIFHAFYVMSFTATTIGFGEIPQPFNDAQRMWVTFSIYISVLGWAFTVGSIIQLVNDPIFRSTLARRLFIWHVGELAEPFYVICGYGQSGARLAASLDNLGNRLVIIEPDAERLARVAIQEFRAPPLTIAADARVAQVLSEAGLCSPHCQALISLADKDPINEAIAVGARFLCETVQIVVRTKTTVASANLGAIGTVQVINPFETFAMNIGLTLRDPAILQIEEWLTAEPGSPCPQLLHIPRGSWVLVGFGEMGRAITRVLDREGIEWKALVQDDEGHDDPRLIRGDYTEATLRDAAVENADVLYAGTETDSVNLWVTTLARRANSKLFVVIRQNHIQDRALVSAARADLIFVQSELMVHEALQLLKTPLLGRFIGRLRASPPEMVAAATARVRNEAGPGAPRAWTFECDAMQPGMFAAFFQNASGAFRIAHLLADPTSPEERMPVAALMLERRETFELLPGPDTVLKPGDRVLFVGTASARRLQSRYVGEPGTVSWVLTGTEPPRGLVFRWWHKRAQRLRAARALASGTEMDKLPRSATQTPGDSMGNRDKQRKEQKKPKKPPAPKPTP